MPHTNAKFSKCPPAVPPVSTAAPFYSHRPKLPSIRAQIIPGAPGSPSAAAPTRHSALTFGSIWRIDWGPSGRIGPSPVPVSTHPVLGPRRCVRRQRGVSGRKFLQLNLCPYGEFQMSGNTLDPKPEDLLRHLLEGTSAKIGREFLRALVRSTAQAMNVAGVWVTEFIPERNVLRTLAFWMNDQFVEDFEYSLKGTPCEQVIRKGRLLHFPDRVIELFPDDADLPKLNAISYAGVPFLQPDGSILGHLSALDTKTLNLAPEVEAVFRIFAARAAAELNRIKADTAVRESEERFSRLFES